MQDWIEYERYQFSKKEELYCVVMAVMLAVLAAWILYQNIFGVVIVVVIYPLYRKNYKLRKIKKRKQELEQQFVDGIQSISLALLSGYSIENAWIEAERELRDLYGANAYMTIELKQMNAAIQVNQSVEELLYRFALRSGCEDILEFAEVFRFAKRCGGNFAKIIQNTIVRIRQKCDTQEEIQTILAGKKMEQKVMNVVPIFLLAYLNITSNEFLSPLYGNAFGICVMSFAFLVYMVAFIWAEKIINIRI